MTIVAFLFCLHWIGWKGMIIVPLIVFFVWLTLRAIFNPDQSFGLSNLPSRSGGPATDTDRQRSAAVKIIESHVGMLSDKKAQLVRKGSYGEQDLGAWEREKRYFINSVVKQQIGHACLIKDSTLSDFIEIKIGDHRQKYPELVNRGATLEHLTPIQYEAHCADILQEAGWHATTTKASGDQGGDIIAEKGPLKVVIQCKKYSAPVSNSAVQEVTAARGFYGASHAAVVTTSCFTKAAQILAQRNGVALLSHDELAEMERKLV